MRSTQCKFYLSLLLALFVSANLFAAPKADSLFIKSISVSKAHKLSKKQVRKHIVDVIFETNKYELALYPTKQTDSFGNEKYREKELSVGITPKGSGLLLSTKLNDSGEHKEVLTRVKKRISAAELIVAIRMQLYEVILGRDAYLSKRIALLKHSKSKVAHYSKRRQSVRKQQAGLAKKAKRVANKKTVTKKRIKKKRTLLALNEKRPTRTKKRVVVSKKKRKSVHVASRKKRAERLPKLKKTEKKPWIRWPYPYFSIGVLTGQKLSQHMNKKSTDAILEYGLGIHFIDYGLKFYYTYNTTSAFDGTEEVMKQTNTMFVLSKDLWGFKPLFGLNNIHHSESNALNVGALIGLGKNTLSGELVQEETSVRNFAVGSYVSFLGIGSLEMRYQHTDSTIFSGSSNEDLSSLVFKLNLAYPM